MKGEEHRQKEIQLFKATLITCFLCVLSSFTLNADPPDWNVNPADYEFNMTGVLRVKTENNAFLDEANTMIGVFVAGETRGVVNSDDIIFVGGAAYFPVTMYSNEQDGEVMDFKVYVASEDSVFTANETAVFDRAITLGSPANPFILTIGLCVDVLVLGTAYSPISGTYKAGTEIRLEGIVTIEIGESLTLDAPLVRSENVLNLKDDAMVIIQGTGCN
ncbi:MAG: hypothetical protein P1U56_04055 [Saprospiraceae bacterium]|nr:hypothetical protein [Saprospiraceae bacterium]